RSLAGHSDRAFLPQPELALQRVRVLRPLPALARLRSPTSGSARGHRRERGRCRRRRGLKGPGIVTCYRGPWTALEPEGLRLAAPSPACFSRSFHPRLLACTAGASILFHPPLEEIRVCLRTDEAEVPRQGAEGDSWAG